MLHNPLGMVRSVRPGLITGSRVRFIVTLAAVAAGVAVLGAPRVRPIDARHTPVAGLPWADVMVGETRLGPMRDSSVLLYVLPSCSHCDSAVRVFARALPQADFEGLVVAGSGRDEAELYRRRFGLVAIGIDSSRSFGRRAGVRLVPTLISLKDSVAVVTPVPSPQWLERKLATR